MATDDPKHDMRIAIVLIGRNEGARLVRCLGSVQSAMNTEPFALVYVDSGSSDSSVQEATRAGADVVALDMSKPFSAARARNAGWRRALQQHPKVTAVHFFDGDCEILPGWIELARTTLESDVNVAAVCGYRRERFPEQSWYNRVCDVEWRFAPAGEARAFGGDVLIRANVLSELDGYREDVIAAEDDELAIRMRARGHRIVRVDEESTLHDAAIFAFRQWWQRQLRAGHGFAQIQDLHGEAHAHFHKEMRRTLFWGAALPSIAVGLAPITLGTSLSLLAVYPAQALRIAWNTRKRGFATEDSLAWGASCAISKIPEALGVAKYWSRRARGRATTIIEYK